MGMEYTLLTDQYRLSVLVSVGIDARLCLCEGFLCVSAEQYTLTRTVLYCKVFKRIII